MPILACKSWCGKKNKQYGMHASKTTTAVEIYPEEIIVFISSNNHLFLKTV
jgi:hypothetical protein